MAQNIKLIDGLPVNWCPQDAYRAIDDALMSGTGGQSHIAIVGLMLTSLLLLKNAAYGNSALAPQSVFATVDSRTRLAVRMDDKLNRIINGHPFGTENERVDLAGYLLLDYIAAHLEEDSQ